MKTPNPKDLQTLSKAHVSDPIIAGTPSSASTTATNDRRTKLTVRLDAELHGRIRAAFLADLQAGSGLTSISAWVSHYLEQAVTDVENRLNHGKQLTAIGSGIIPNFPVG